MHRFRISAAASGLMLIFMATTVSAELVTPNSLYREVDGFGVGNCIFSSAPMAFDQESGYTGVQDKFSSDDRPAEIRCYFGSKVGEHRTKGAFYNSLRDENEYFNYLTVEEPDGGATFYERLGVYHPSGKSIDWDQMRMGLAANGAVNCNFKADDKLGSDGCMDIDNQVMALAASKGADLPYTAEVCISMYYKWTDHYEEKWHEHSGSWRRERIGVSAQYMAGPNCIQYTVSGSGPAKSPVAEKEEEPKKKKKGLPPPPFKLPF